MRRPIRPADRLLRHPASTRAHLQAGRMRPDMTLRASRRGLVPPFIAMDVLRAANEREAAGADVIHLEVGQPGTPAPEPVLEAARRALGRRADRLYRCARHRAVAAGDRRPLPGAIRGRRRSRRGRRHDRLVGRVSARVSRRLRARRPGRARGPRLPGLSQHLDGPRHRAGADRRSARMRITSRPPSCSPRRARSTG